MKVICIQTTSKNFDLKEIKTIFTNQFDYNFDGGGIELHHEYFVMGILCYKNSNCLYYLIDTDGRPRWYPYPLFRVSDNSIPKNWYIKVNDKKDDSDVYYLCGFNELCNDPNFYYNLLDREESSMLKYFERKIEWEKEIEKQEFDKLYGITEEDYYK